MDRKNVLIRLKSRGGLLCGEKRVGEENFIRAEIERGSTGSQWIFYLIIVESGEDKILLQREFSSAEEALSEMSVIPFKSGALRSLKIIKDTVPRYRFSSQRCHDLSWHIDGDRIGSEEKAYSNYVVIDDTATSVGVESTESGV